MAAGKDIFGYKRNPKPSGVFSTEDSKMFIGGGSGVATEGYLVQAWNMSYSQNVEELFEIGSNRLYWSKGRPVGQGTVSRVVGAKDADTNSGGFFPTEAFDICNGGATMVISAVGGHCTEGNGTTQVMNKGIQLKMSGVVIASVGFSMQVGDVKLLENFGWRFGHLELTPYTA